MKDEEKKLDKVEVAVALGIGLIAGVLLAAWGYAELEEQKAKEKKK